MKKYRLSPHLLSRCALILSVGFLGLLTACRTDKASDSDRIDIARFMNPSKDDRATLFYSLNDSLEPALIRRQIEDFARGGVGGVFLHARGGLLTQYFEDDWWAAIDAAVDQCVKSGINPWFYDEYKWPSGYAAGYVPNKDESYRGHHIARIAKGKSIPENGVVIFEDENYNYACMTALYGNPWLNGTCKIDYLNPEAIKTFIDHTYKTYAERNKTLYNSAGRGIFFDEPDIHPETNGRKYDGVLSYSPAFREEFKKAKGYDIVEKLPCLYEEKGDFRKVRYDYWQMLGAQYEKAFVGQLSAFCEANDLVLTGHFFPEENLRGNKTGIGNLMRQVRNEGMPGMDHLELRIDGGLNVAKCISSASNQYGKQRRMSELFGVSGQNMSFEDRKWIANWHIALGINFFVEHLALYSMKGERKRDFPPALSYQQPWWQKNKQVEDYMARLCYLSTLGRYDASTLLLIPLESEYIATQSESTKLFADYYSSMENLMNIHCDFDLGDELIMEETASVQGASLQVGEMNYRYVVVPRLLTLRESTARLLLEFSKQGGKLIFLDDYPQYVDVDSSPLLGKLKQNSILLPNTRKDLALHLPAGVNIAHRETAQIYTQKRNLPGGAMYFITNLSRTTPERVTVTFDTAPDNLTLWNPNNGKAYRVTADANHQCELEVGVADFLILTTGAVVTGELHTENYTLPASTRPVTTVSTPWAGRKLSPNAILLDYAHYSMDNGKTFSQSEPVIAIMDRLSKQAYNGPLMLHFDILVEQPLENVNLVVESPSMYQSILVNGAYIHSFNRDDYYVDASFKKSGNIASFLKVGKNVITLALNFKSPIISDPIFANRYGTELESIYLIGDFAVNARHAEWNVWETEKNRIAAFVKKPVHRLNGFSLSPESSAFDNDLASCGYPFYAGSFEVNNTFVLEKVEAGKQYYVNLPLSEAILYGLSVNGHELEELSATPFTWNITPYIKEGANDISFTLCNSLRNLLGPHHHKGGELKGTSPLSFTGSGGWPHGEGDSDWYDARLDKKVSLRIWTDDYYVIPFGFIQPVEIVESMGDGE